jgi:hypothetical protein
MNLPWHITPVNIEAFAGLGMLIENLFFFRKFSKKAVAGQDWPLAALRYQPGPCLLVPFCPLSLAVFLHNTPFSAISRPSPTARQGHFPSYSAKCPKHPKPLLTALKGPFFGQT